MIRVETLRAWSGNVQGWAAARPSLPARLAAFIMLAFFALIGAIILIPLLLLGALLTGVFGAYVWIKARLTRARAPNGPLDGRRNVRVVQRTPEATIDQG